MSSGGHFSSPESASFSRDSTSWQECTGQTLTPARRSAVLQQDDKCFQSNKAEGTEGEG